MIITKNNNYYDKEFTNDIEEYTFTTTEIEQDIIGINDVLNQSEIDIQLSSDLLGKSRIQLKIPLEI